MTPPAGYTEDALVERPAISLLADLGWETVNAYHEFDHGASTLGRRPVPRLSLPPACALLCSGSIRVRRPRPSARLSRS